MRTAGVLREVNLGHLPAQLVGSMPRRTGSTLRRRASTLVVARALVNKVRLVIADEATSGLDIANEELLYGRMSAPA